MVMWSERKVRPNGMYQRNNEGDASIQKVGRWTGRSKTRWNRYVVLRDMNIVGISADVTTGGVLSGRG